MRARWDKADLYEYYKSTWAYFEGCGLLDKVGNVGVNENGIDELYSQLIGCLNMAANDSVPMKKCNFYKFWWDGELDDACCA
jgi:hypothetical protein